MKAGALQVRFNGLDTGVIPQTPDFMKSLALDHARDGEVMIAYAMNGEPLPLLNGFPLRLVVPGWYATYWVKMLNDIEILNEADDNFWMAKAYLIPDTPYANVNPEQQGVKTFPSIGWCRARSSPMSKMGLCSRSDKRPRCGESPSAVTPQ